MDENVGILIIPENSIKKRITKAINNVRWPFQVTGEDKPGLSYGELEQVYENCPWITGIVNQISMDASKVSYNITEKKNVTGAEKQISLIEDFFDDPSEGEECFGDIIGMIVWDCLVFDAHGLEIVTKRDGTPAEIVNVSGKTLKPYWSEEYRRVIGYFHEIVDKKIKIFFPVGKKRTKEKKIGAFKVSDHPFTYFRIIQRAHSPYGFSPLEALTNELSTEISQEKENARFFNNRARPGGIITGLKTKEQAEDFQTYWRRFYTGAENAGKTIITYGDGINWAPVPELRKEWDIALKQWTLKKFCAVYGTNDAELGIEKTENRSTAQVRHEIAKNRILAFLLSRIQQRMNKIVLPLFFDNEKIKVKFEFNSVDNQDLNELVQIYSALLDRGVITINEVRDRLNLGEGVEWGDYPFDLRSLILSGAWLPQQTSKAARGILRKNIEITENEATEISKTPYQQIVAQGEKELVRTFQIAFSDAITKIKEEIRRSRKSMTLDSAISNILMIALQASTTALKRQALRTYFKGYLAQKYSLPPISFNVASTEAIEFIRTYKTPFMLRFCEQTRRDILDIVQQGISSDSSIANIMRELQTVIDSDKNHLEMIARTESKQAFNIGALDRFEKHTNLVRVLDGDGCEACREANGQVWPIDEARARPLEHPDCVRDFIPVYEEEES